MSDLASCSSHIVIYIYIIIIILRLPTLVFLGVPCDSAGKEPACNVGDLGLIPGLGRSLGEGKGYLFQYSGLEKSMGSQRVRHN